MNPSPISNAPAIASDAPVIVPAEPPVLTTQPPLGAKAVSGAFWTLFFAAGNKVVTLAGQIALAWLLVPEDMGLIAMALSFTSVASLLLLGGLGDILVQRHERFDEDAPQVFWLSLSTSIVAAGLVALCAPLGAMLFDEPRVRMLIMIEALSWPLEGLATIYGAKLKRDLRFKPLAIMQIAAGLANTGTAVALAAAGFGVYALALAPVARRLTTLMLMWFTAGQIPIGRAHPRLWPALLQPAAWLMLTTFFISLQHAAPNFVLGHFSDAHEVGLLSWGTALAAQAVYLLATNLQNVLFPTLARLSAEPERQFNAVNQTVRMVTAVLAPVCVLQIVTAEPLIKLVFKRDWLPAAPVVAWLSFGLLMQPLHVMAGALLKARGRFSTLATLTGVQMVILTGACVAGAWHGNAATTARAAGCALFLTGLLAGWVTYREYGHGVGQILEAIGLPLLIAGISVCVATLTSIVLSQHIHQQLLCLISGVTLTYVLLAQIFVPNVTKVLKTQISNKL